MTAIPAPTIVLSGEEWPDADFDLPDGEPIHASDAESDKDEDWDAEFDLGSSAGAKPMLSLEPIALDSDPKPAPQMFTIRPPLLPSSPSDDDEDEGVSTIKATAFPKISAKPSQPPPTIDEDFEDGLALPDDLTQLSLRPLSLKTQSSKSSLEWGEKDQTSSSQSSDAPSSLGFADSYPSSNYTSASLPETETEDDDDEGDLEGLVIPSGLFESGQSGKKLAKLLEAKKKTAYDDDRVKIASPDPEDDFEMGLVLDDDSELSATKLLQTAQQKSQRVLVPAITRSKSVPPRTAPPTRPPSRPKFDRAKSPSNPPVSSAQQLRRLNAPPSPPRPSPARSQTYSQAVTSAPSSSFSFLAPKPGSLRIQKSHSGLKPPSPTSTRKLARKASLPALSDSVQPEASGSGSASGAPSARYETPTASSRAKTHTNSTGRLTHLDYNVPPTRPSTPSSNPVALRLTMPTSSSRLKARPPISSVFPGSATSTVAPPLPRSTSPSPFARTPSRPPSRPKSRTSSGTSNSPIPQPPKVLKRPKRPKTYGDGTELDGIEDLPLNREKESKYRVAPKGYGNRVPGASYAKVAESAASSSSKGTLRRTRKRDLSFGSDVANSAPPSKTLKRTGRLESTSRHTEGELFVKKKSPTSPNQTKRKPTLIRNLGGSNAPKVVGEMKWNPQTLRWEGNDQALRDFDAAVGTSTRPALITHLTGSSIGSPVGSLASGARVVGNMIFDPSRMCWISTLPPEEDEPDVFADLADDEDEDWEVKGGTIRANQPGSATNTNAPPLSSSSGSRKQAPSPALSHRRSLSDAESDRGSRASYVCKVDTDFRDKCRAAEERHRAEMKGWVPSHSTSHAESDRTHLFEIRALATRQY
ncbi:hypothetical protein QCA50_002088 [Cerrena zonata]|uniref:Protein byr4 n=1 Tax=Cerrena zonata TaxID=2478898 RepID=A0AAW0GYB8_9APHY